MIEKRILGLYIIKLKLKIMMTIICIMVLIYLMRGKNAENLINRIKNVDWNGRYEEIKCRLKPYAIKYGRKTARPLLQFYYVMKDPGTSATEKAMIYGALIYVVSPANLIPRSVYGLLGMTDEAAAIAFVYKKIKNKITPAINSKVDDTLREWFGDEYEIVNS